jgi:hypothetical protein
MFAMEMPNACVNCGHGRERDVTKHAAKAGVVCPPAMVRAAEGQKSDDFCGWQEEGSAARRDSGENGDGRDQRGSEIADGGDQNGEIVLELPLCLNLFECLARSR